MHTPRAQLIEIIDGIVKFKSHRNICLELCEVIGPPGLNYWVHFLCTAFEWFDRTHATEMLSVIEAQNNVGRVIH